MQNRIVLAALALATAASVTLVPGGSPSEADLNIQAASAVPAVGMSPSLASPVWEYVAAATATTTTTTTTTTPPPLPPPTTTTTTAPPPTVLPESQSGTGGEPWPGPEPEARPSGDDGCGGWSDLVYAHFPGEGAYACRVMLCESGGNPNAVSHTNDHGLFQINRPTFDKPGNPDGWQQRTGTPWSSVYDPATNVDFARQIRAKYGWGAWACAS